MKKWDGLKLIEPTLQAKTASGGKHLFYFKREDIQISQMIGFLPGVDIKAHPNNYVLVAPSATDKGQYEWDLEKSKEGLTMVTPSRELIEAIKKQYALTNGHSYDGKDGLRALRARTYQKLKVRQLNCSKPSRLVLVMKVDVMTSSLALLAACCTGRLMMN